MTELFDAAKTFLSSLSTDQLVALFIGVMALSCAVKLLKEHPWRTVYSLFLRSRSLC